MATAQVNSVAQGGGQANSGSNLIIPIQSLSSVVVLNFGGFVGSGIANSWWAAWSASSPASATPYVIPNGVSFYVTSMQTESNTANTNFNLGYGTAAVASDGQNSAPTGAVDYNSTASSIYVFSTGSTANAIQVQYPVGISFAAGKYPYVHLQSAQTLAVTLIGILQ